MLPVYSIFAHTHTHPYTPTHTHTHTHTRPPPPSDKCTCLTSISLACIRLHPRPTLLVSCGYCTCAACEMETKILYVCNLQMETKILYVCSLQDGNQDTKRVQPARWKPSLSVGKHDDLRDL